MIRFSDEDKAVLQFLYGAYDSYIFEHTYCSFRSIADGCAHTLQYTMPWKQTRRVCRRLKRAGYLEFGKGLWSDEGPAGAGYRLTKAGSVRIKQDGTVSR